MDGRSQFNLLELQSTMVCPSRILQYQALLKESTKSNQSCIGKLKRIESEVHRKRRPIGNRIAILQSASYKE